ncbi:MAG: sigma-70 family RNA polymerase sigma factor [Clostridia bacterium]|nr:sigma-70 family RNA polymerase sigma factor [Clostridia bacterium]
MGYLEVEDKRARNYLKDEIITTIMRFSDNEKSYGKRFVSLNESMDSHVKKEIGQLSTYVDDCSVSFFGSEENNILDSLENQDLIEAMKYLSETETDLLTKLFVKQQEEYEIAQELNTTIDTIQFKKMQIIEKIKEHFKL